jgi:drug/metabolite transporter (DMT)-like permease
MQRMIIMRYIKMNSTVKNYTALFLGVAALSTSAIFVKLSTAPSPVTAFYRLLFTALALLPFLLCSEKNRREFAAVDRRQVLSIVLSGFLLAVHYTMWFESLRFTSVSSSTVLVSMQPLFSLFWGFLFLKERVRPSALVGCLIAIAGSAVIGWGDFAISSKALLGDLLALSSAGVISLYFLIGQVTRKNTGVIVYSVLSYFSSAAFLLVYVLVSRNPFFDYPALTWCSFLGLAFISTIGGQFVFNLLLKDISATMVSMGILGEPVGTCILAFLILQETIAPRQFGGIVVIMSGLSLYFFYPLVKEHGCKDLRREDYG